MIITAHAYARAGLVGNPSDGYFGKTDLLHHPQLQGDRPPLGEPPL